MGHSMPRASTSSLSVNMDDLRVYLRHTHAHTGYEVLHDALVIRRAGARQLVELLLEVRSNARSRRTLAQLGVEYHRQPRSRWLRNFAQRLFVVYSSMRLECRPYALSIPSRRFGTLPRAMQRSIREGGLVKLDRRTLEQQANQCLRQLFHHTHQRQCVLWMDNWYWEWYGTNPSASDQSTNVTAMALLLLEEFSPSHPQTRSVRLPQFPGYPSLSLLVSRVDYMASRMVQAQSRWVRQVGDVNALQFQRADIRIPLDVPREGGRSVQWRSYDLSQLQVGSNEQLVRLLVDVRELQQHTAHQLPLLVDEKIHHAIMRMLYSASLRSYDVHASLANVPVLFGVWHAYKQTVTVVYRSFFTLLATLEADSPPVVGHTVHRHRKVRYMEKLFAALLLAREDVRRMLDAQLQVMERAARHAPGTDYHSPS